MTVTATGRRAAAGRVRRLDPSPPDLWHAAADRTGSRSADVTGRRSVPARSHGRAGITMARAWHTASSSCAVPTSSRRTRTGPALRLVRQGDRGGGGVLPVGHHRAVGHLLPAGPRPSPLLRGGELPGPLGGRRRLGRSPPSRWGWPTGCSPPSSPPANGRVVPPGGTPGSSPRSGGHPRPPRSGRAVARLGIRTLGDFADSRVPRPRPVRADGVPVPPGGRGRSGELAGASRRPRRVDDGAGEGPRPRAVGGPGSGVGERRRCPGRSGARRGAGPPRSGRRDDGATPGGPGAGPAARFVTWNAGRRPRAPPSALRGPGRSPPRRRRSCIPLPSPPSWPTPGGSRCGSGRGLLTAAPARLSVEGGPWTAVTAWAGPWPSEERWWSGPAPPGALAGGDRRRTPICCSSNGAAGGSKPPTDDRRTTMAYAELHAHSNFSFLDGASHPEELAAEATRLGLPGSP